MITSDIFEVLSEDTGGCIVYVLTGIDSKIPIVLSDEIAQIVLTNYGTIANPFSELLTASESEEVWMAINSIILWEYNSYYHDQVHIRKGVMLHLGFSLNEIEELTKILTELVATDWEGFYR